MPPLTELEEFNGRIFSINISLLAELADILGSVSFGEIGTMLETQARYRILLNWCIIWVISLLMARASTGWLDPAGTVVALNRIICESSS